jgi:hypothetical protein
MRSLPTISKNRKQTFAQEVQKAKFSTAQGFLRNFGPLLTTSFQEVAGLTPRNEALAIVLNQAIGGIYPNLMIDYGLLLVSKGSLKKPVNPNVASTQPGKLTFTWTDDTGSGNAKAGDKAILVAYDEQYGDVIFITDGAARSSRHAELDADFFSGKPVHTWFGFISENGKLRSDSTYTGVITVQ